MITLSPTPFRPRGAVTGVGSLPCTSPDEAVAFVEAHAPEVPFVPQPPVSTGVVEGIRDQVRQLADRSGEHHQWFEAFRDAAMAGAFPRARALKVQLTGPITLGDLCSPGVAPEDRSPELMAQLAAQVTDLAVWLLRRLRPPGLPVLVTVDEPCLGTVSRHETHRWRRPAPTPLASDGERDPG